MAHCLLCKQTKLHASLSEATMLSLEAAFCMPLGLACAWASSLWLPWLTLRGYSAMCLCKQCVHGFVAETSQAVLVRLQADAKGVSTRDGESLLDMPARPSVPTSHCQAQPVRLLCNWYYRDKEMW